MLTEHLEEHIWELLASDDPTIQQHGLELVRALELADREVIVEGLLRSSWPQKWMLAACCLLDLPEALRRARLLAARYALRRLERLRAAGQEPDELAWRFLEAAEAMAAGTSEDDALGSLKRACGDYARCVSQDDDFGPPHPIWDRLVNDALFRFEDVPDVPEDEREQVGVYERDLLRAEPWALDFEDDLDRDWDALHAAACAVMPWVWGVSEDEPDPVAAPQTRAEAAWLRAAWEALIRQGRDPIALVWAA
jgi:hypothetical protein